MPLIPLPVDFSQKGLLEGLVRFLQRRAGDPVHRDNGDVIGKFIDNFMIAEIKRLERHPEVVPGVIQFPDAMLKPGAPEELTSGRLAAQLGIAAPTEAPAPAPARRATRTAPEPPDVTSTPVAPVARTPETQALVRAAVQADPALRNGNGHVSEKKRPLSDAEKTTLRRRFIQANGQIPEDRTVTWTTEFNDGLAPDQRLSAFQVPGFIAYLHNKVADGAIELRDMQAYKTFLDSHRARYPRRYPTLARRARRANPDATTQDAAARALWNKSGLHAQPPEEPIAGGVSPDDLIGFPEVA